MTKARDLGDFISDGTIAETVTADGLNLGDNEKIQLGASQDLQLFHDGSNSFINELGTGNLYVRAQNTFNLQKAGTSEFMLKTTTDGAVELYYDDSKKIETTTTGATVTGTVAVSGSFNATSGTFTVQSNGTDILNVTSTEMTPQTDGAISLGSATNGFNNMYLDGSAYVDGNVGIGTTSPKSNLDLGLSGSVTSTPSSSYSDYAVALYGSSTFGSIRNFVGVGEASAVAAGIGFVDTGSGGAQGITFNTGNLSSTTERFRISSTGAVGLSGANYGTAGQVLTSGGSNAAPTWADAAGGGTAEFTATGTIPNGDTVALRSDGTVEVVSQSTSSTPVVLENSVISNSNFVDAVDIIYCSGSDRYVAVWIDGSNKYVKGAVGQLTNNTITFGTVYNIHTVACRMPHQALSYDINQDKVVVYYREDSGNSYPYVEVLDVDPVSNSLSQGSQVLVFGGAPDTSSMAIVYEPNSGKHCVFWSDGNCEGAVVTVSGTSASVGSATTARSGNWENVSATVDTDNNTPIFVYNNSNTNTAFATIITISGTTLSFGTLANILGSRIDYTSCAYDPVNSRVVIAYSDASSSYYGKVLIGSIASGSFSFGSAVTFAADTTYSKVILYDPDTARFSICFRDGGNNNKAKVLFGTVSGGFLLSMTFTTETTIEDDISVFVHQTYDTTADKFVSMYRNSTDQKIGYTLYSGTSTNSGSWIGVAAEAISSGSSGKITLIGGINESQTGLTAGSTYYVAEDGTLQTGSTAVKVGRAVSATKLYVTEGNA